MGRYAFLLIFAPLPSLFFFCIYFLLLSFFPFWNPVSPLLDRLYFHHLNRRFCSSSNITLLKMSCLNFTPLNCFCERRKSFLVRFTLVAVIWVLLTSIFVVYIKHFLDIFGLRETFCFVCITLLMGFKLFLKLIKRSGAVNYFVLWSMQCIAGFGC